ncbi:hypothetical protein BDR05DRAFT_637501 [Suillus weaverae]|nr:hypothetical protein BDR05DRAFT_637501 [Suillus weaverae]
MAQQTIMLSTFTSCVTHRFSTCAIFLHVYLCLTAFEAHTAYSCGVSLRHFCQSLGLYDGVVGSPQFLAVLAITHKSATTVCEHCSTWLSPIDINSCLHITQFSDVKNSNLDSPINL